MKIGDIILSRHSAACIVLTLPNDSGWLMVKKLLDGLVFEIHISNFIAF